MHTWTDATTDWIKVDWLYPHNIKIYSKHAQDKQKILFVTITCLNCNWKYNIKKIPCLQEQGPPCRLAVEWYFLLCLGGEQREICLVTSYESL